VPLFTLPACRLTVGIVMYGYCYITVSYCTFVTSIILECSCFIKIPVDINIVLFSIHIFDMILLMSLILYFTVLHFPPSDLIQYVTFPPFVFNPRQEVYTISFISRPSCLLVGSFVRSLTSG